MFIPESQFS